MTHHTWFGKDPTQAASFVVLLGGLILLFLGLSFHRMRTANSNVRPLGRPHKTRTPLGPKPVMWDVYCPPQARDLEGGRWDALQPLSTQFRADDHTSSPGDGVRPRTADVAVLIAMPAPPAPPTSRRVSRELNEKEKALHDEDEEEGIPDVVLGYALLQTSPIPGNFAQQSSLALIPSPSRRS